jgi:hypothetical protein
MNVDIAIYRQARRESPQLSVALAIMARKRTELAQQAPETRAAVDRTLADMDRHARLNRLAFREPGQGLNVDRLV